MPDPTRLTDSQSLSPSLPQNSAGPPEPDRLLLAPEDLWVNPTSVEYVDDSPYIPPSLHSTNHPTNPSPSEGHRPPSPPLYHSDSEQPQFSHLDHSDSPETSESGSLSSRRDKTSSSYSSGDGEVQLARQERDQSTLYLPNPQRAHNPDLYPAYNQHNQRIGLEHLRDDAREHISSGQSHYRPQTHTYGTRALSPQAIRQSRRTVQQSPSPDPVYAQPSRAPEQASPQTNQPPVRRYQVPVDEIPDPEPMMRQMLGMGMEPGQEISLAVLDDPPPGEKPNYPYPTLTKLAIYGSERKKLTLQEIYSALEERFEWFRQRTTSDSAWKRSIRHLLSLNKTFRKVPRPVTDPGKGSYWIVDYSQGEGNKRLRKRNKKPTKALLARKAAEERARQGQQAAGPSNTRSDSEDSNMSGHSAFGAFDDSAIDPALSAQGHRIGTQRPAPRTRIRANPPYTNRLSSSESSGSPEPLRHHRPSTSSLGHQPSHMNPASHAPALTQNQPAFGQPSLRFPVTFGASGQGSSPVSISRSTNLEPVMPTEPRPTDGFARYQNSPTSFLQGRTLPVPTLGGLAAANARSSGSRPQNPSNITLPPIRPASRQATGSGSSGSDERGFSMAPFSSPD